MNFLDIIIIILILVAFVNGLRKGLVRQIIGFTGIVAGLIVAVYLYEPTGEWLRVLQPEMDEAHVLPVAFVGLFLVVWLFSLLLSWVATQFLDFVALGAFNKLMGGLIGAGRVAVFLVFAFYAFMLVKEKTGKELPGFVSSSKSMAYSKQIVEVVLPAI